MHRTSVGKNNRYNNTLHDDEDDDGCEHVRMVNRKKQPVYLLYCTEPYPREVTKMVKWVMVRGFV